MLAERWIVDRVPTERFPGYTRGNAGDVMADPVSPLGWTFAWESGIVLGCRDGFVALGVFDADEYSPVKPETFGLFGGYFYNSLMQARLFGVRSGAGWQAIDNAYFDDPSAVPPYVEDEWHVSPRHSEKLAKTMAWFMATPNVPEIEKQKLEAKALRDSRPDLTTLTDAQLIARARTIQRHLVAMFAQHAVASLGASVGPGVIAAVVAEIDPTVVTTLLGGIGDVDSAQIANAIWAMSRTVRGSVTLTAMFEQGLDGLGERLASSAGSTGLSFMGDVAEFVYAHGSRGPNEWDPYNSTYETRSELLYSAIDRLRRNDDTADPKQGEARNAAERERVTGVLATKLADNPEAAAMLSAGLRSAAVFMVARERCKSNNIRAVHEMRMAFDEVARRRVVTGELREGRHFYMLTEDELDAFVAEPSSFTALLAERHDDYRSLYELEPPYIVDTQADPLSTWPRKADAAIAPVSVGDVLKGVAGSPGVATGTAKVLLTVDDPMQLEPGDILIAPSTDPSWTPLFLAVSAVVVNVGAVGTHAVIVSRELGIPCVPSIADATRRIPTGATVTVNGDEGTLTIDALP